MTRSPRGLPPVASVTAGRHRLRERCHPRHVSTRMPLFSHQVLMSSPAPAVIMRGTMRSPISTTVEVDVARGQRLHDDAADEARAHLQHAAPFGRRHDRARILERPARVHVRQVDARDRRAVGVRAGRDQQPVEGQRFAVVSVTTRLAVSMDFARPCLQRDAQRGPSARRPCAAACPSRRCCRSAGTGSPCASKAAPARRRPASISSAARACAWSRRRRRPPGRCR